ncbi:MAG: hypothetical protein N3F66_02990 [Spirochaetes bacterium]|nr:hypothetical protein [Spirochaetota bacterium]
MYKRVVSLLFGIFLIVQHTVVFGNEVVKQKIIAFEQSVPWSDVYDSFKSRQKSWHQDVMAASSPQELGTLLVEFHGFIIKDKLGDEWDRVKPQWVAKAGNATTYDVVADCLQQLQNYYFQRVKQDGSDVKKDIITFEQFVPWEDVKEGFKSRQQGWHYDVMNAKTPQQLGLLLLEFHDWIYPQKFSGEWAVIKPAWIKKAKNTSTWQDVKDLLKELQWNYRKGK